MSHTKPDGKIFGPGHSYIITPIKSSTQSMSPYIFANQSTYTSRLENCNLLQCGLPCGLLHKLQLVQNCAARLILGGGKYGHITPLLRELHWLPVEHRINLKLLLITFKALNNLAPSYISSLLHLYTPNRLLRSSSKFQLQVPPSNLKTYGDRACSVSPPPLSYGIAFLTILGVAPVSVLSSYLKKLIF